MNTLEKIINIGTLVGTLATAACQPISERETPSATYDWQGNTIELYDFDSDGRTDFVKAKGNIFYTSEGWGSDTQYFTRVDFQRNTIPQGKAMDDLTQASIDNALHILTDSPVEGQSNNLSKESKVLGYAASRLTEKQYGQSWLPN